MTSLTAESIRAQVLERMRSLSSEAISDRSETVIARFLASESEDFWAGKKIGLYRSLRTEVQLFSLETELVALGAKLCYPRILDPVTGLGLSVMRFAHVDDPARDRSWEKGPYGGIEPTMIHAEVEASSLDLIVVPGLAFGRSGERIGRGKGYYDRFLAGCSGVKRVALAFDFQVFESLPQNPWDERVNCVVSETEEWVIR